MKNKITYICIFAILLTSLWGCSKYNVNKETEAGGQDTNTAVSRKYDEYTVLEVEGVCNTSSDAQHSSKYKFNISSEHVESEHKGQQKDFEILGIQVTGLYKKTESSDLDKNDRIIYEGFSADGNKITFGMDEETGQIRKTFNQ